LKLFSEDKQIPRQGDIMEILNKKQIQQKVRRLSIEILERNLQARSIYLAGINNNGSRFADMIQTELEALKPPFEIIPCQIRLNPAAPVKDPVTLDVPVSDLKGKQIIIIDDVANTGRTMFYAMKPLMEVLPKKVEVAVLVDRKHKSFPVHVDYVGISLATTSRENIVVELVQKPSVLLE